MGFERDEDPRYDGVLDGYTCPCCGDGFIRKDKLVFAYVDQNYNFYFHRKCLTDSKMDLLEDMGFYVEETDGDHVES